MKARFGISVDENVAEQLNKLSKVLNVDRSSIVEDAIKATISEHNHYLYEHRCLGVMIIRWETELRKRGTIEEILEDYKDVVRFSTHVHIENTCASLILMDGSSSKIKELHTKLKMLKNISVRYIPLSEIKK